MPEKRGGGGWNPLTNYGDAISSNIDQVLSINPSADAFVLGEFNIHHKDWLTYYGGTDRPGESQITITELLTPHWEIVIMFLSQFLQTFCQTQKAMPCFIA